MLLPTEPVEPNFCAEAFRQRWCPQHVPGAGSAPSPLPHSPAPPATQPWEAGGKMCLAKGRQPRVFSIMEIGNPKPRPSSGWDEGQVSFPLPLLGPKPQLPIASNFTSQCLHLLPVNSFLLPKGHQASWKAIFHNFANLEAPHCLLPPGKC